MRFLCELRADPNRANGARPWFVLAVVLGVAAAASVWQTPLRINHDCASYLQMAEMVLDGAVPYCGVVDINPPLSLYLHIPPAWLARRLRISPIIVFQVAVVSLLFASAAEMFFLMRRRASGLRPAEQAVVLCGWMALFLLVDWRGDVGQREHLFVLMYVPYLFLRVLRYRRGSVAVWFAVLLGLQAGVGVSLKPHFLLSAAAVEVVLLLGRRCWRTVLQPECLALAGVVSAYAAHWLFVPVAMREAFFCRWLPLVCHGYGAFDASCRDIAADLLASPFSAAGLVGVLAALLLLFTRRRLRLRLHLAALATLALGGMAMLCLQHKGFTYHRIPFDAAALLCLLMVGLSTGEATSVAFRSAKVACFRGAKGDRSRESGRSPCRREMPLECSRGALRKCLVFCVAAGALAVWFIERPGSARPDTADYAALRRIVAERTRPGDRVLVMATSVRPAYPMLLQLGCRPGSRYSTAGVVALVYAGVQPPTGPAAYHRHGEATAEERRVLDEYRDDVSRYQPRLILVNNAPGWFGLPDNFNMFDYLVYCGWAGECLKDYREVPGPKGWKVFERRRLPTSIAENR